MKQSGYIGDVPVEFVLEMGFNSLKVTAKLAHPGIAGGVICVVDDDYPSDGVMSQRDARDFVDNCIRRCRDRMVEAYHSSDQAKNFFAIANAIAALDA